MATLFNKIKLYLDARGIDAVEEMGKYNLMVKNSGQVALGNRTSVIEKWDIDGVPQPTQEALDALESQADTVESNDTVYSTRKQTYGDWREQLDEIYHDIDAWKTRIQAIKNSNPKS